MEDLVSEKQSDSEKQSPIKVADSWDSSNNLSGDKRFPASTSVTQISSMPQLDIDDYSQPGTSATDKNQTELEIFSQPGTSGTGQSELMDLLETTTHKSVPKQIGLEEILSQPGASVTDQSNPMDLLGYAVATNYNLFGFEYQYPITSSGSSEQLVDVLPPAVPSLGNEFEEKKLTTKIKSKRFGNKGNKDDKKSGGSDGKGKRKRKTAREKKSETKGKKLKKVEESEEETEELEENKETEETEDEEGARGPRKGTGGRPTIEMQLKNLQLEVNDIVKSNTVQKDFTMQQDCVDVHMQLDIVDVPMQQYVAVQKIDAPIDINMEQNKIPAERNELLMQQDGVFKHRDNIAIHHDDPLHDNASIQKNNDDEDLDNNEVIDPGCLFPDDDPSLTQILILCDQFTKGNEDAMIEFFSMRHPIDQIGRSARRKLFIVKSVVKEYSKTAMRELNETEFKEHDIKARKWVNRGEFMLPKICLFTDKSTSKK